MHVQRVALVRRPVEGGRGQLQQAETHGYATAADVVHDNAGGALGASGADRVHEDVGDVVEKAGGSGRQVGVVFEAVLDEWGRFELYEMCCVFCIIAIFFIKQCITSIESTSKHLVNYILTSNI